MVVKIFKKFQFLIFEGGCLRELFCFSMIKNIGVAQKRISALYYWSDGFASFTKSTADTKYMPIVPSEGLAGL